MKITSLDELFLTELKDLYDAEHRLVEALPKMAKAATEPDLKTAFETHLAETRKQVVRLKGVFEEINESPGRETCEAMKGLIEEGDELMDEVEEGPVLDAGLIAAAQKVEHYEIASYGTLIAWAELAGLDSAAQLLEQTLEEEMAADEKLTAIGESSVYASAEAEAEAADEVETTSSRSGSRDTPAKRAGAGAPARSRRTTR